MIDFIYTYPLIGAMILLLSVLWMQTSVFLVNKHTVDNDLIKKLIPLARGPFNQKLKLKIFVLAVSVIGIYLILIIDFTSYEKPIADFIVNLTFASVIYMFLFFSLLSINTFILNKINSAFRILRRTFLMFIFICIVLLIPLTIFTDFTNYFFLIFNLLLGILGYRELIKVHKSFE